MSELGREPATNLVSVPPPTFTRHDGITRLALKKLRTLGQSPVCPMDMRQSAMLQKNLAVVSHSLISRCTARHRPNSDGEDSTGSRAKTQRAGAQALSSPVAQFIHGFQLQPPAAASSPSVRTWDLSRKRQVRNLRR